MTTYFVDNALQGAGDHSTAGNAGQFNLVWAKLSPGDIVEVADGTAGDGRYTGENNMIKPVLLNGSSGSPIIIQAKNDGQPWIDGEGNKTPLLYGGCTWLDLTGIDFGKGTGLNNLDVLSTTLDSGVTRTTDCNFRRICVWDAAIDKNSMCIATNKSDRILFEDFAAFGTGRKCFQPFLSTFITARRGFTYWTGSTNTGPKISLSCTYRSYDNLIENCITVWSGEDQGPTAPDQVMGALSHDGVLSGEDADLRLKVYGNIAIVPGSAVHIGQDSRGAIFFILQLGRGYSNVDLKDNVAIIEPGFHLTKVSVGLSADSTASLLTSDGLTGIGGAGLGTSNPNWTSIDEDEGDTKDDVSSVFSSATGAQVCKRYVDGVLTGVNLFPWPMQQRIIDAFERSGRTPGYSVEGEIQRLLGTIPAGCITTPPDPDPPDVKKLWIGGGTTGIPGIL